MFKYLNEKTIKKFLKPAQYLANIQNKRQDKNEVKNLYRTENREYKDSIWNMLGSFVGIGANGDYLGNIQNSIDTMREERADNTAARRGYYGALLDYGKSYVTPAQKGKALDDAYKSYIAGDDGYLDYIGKNTSEGVNIGNKKGVYGSVLDTTDAEAQLAYLQNKSTYGVNAETLARMGLTGSGYSDYLKRASIFKKEI